jgi:hypothetical protein
MLGLKGWRWGVEGRVLRAGRVRRRRGDFAVFDGGFLCITRLRGWDDGWEDGKMKGWMDGWMKGWDANR